MVLVWEERITCEKYIKINHTHIEKCKTKYKNTFDFFGDW